VTRVFLGLPAPAKLNLFLHVVGRRDDGYHELQSVFVPIDLADTLDFESRDDGLIDRSGDVIGDPTSDLAVRAATLLKTESGVRAGVSIYVDKRIAAGSGLGGGSSDAATTLLALNRLWNLKWSRSRLALLAQRLGADVPFFLGAGPAFVQGIGERQTSVAFAPTWFAVVFPCVSIATAEIFADPGLTLSSKPTIIAAFLAAQSEFPRALFGANDLEAVVCRRVPAVQQAITSLSRFGPARMTGSGSAVFVPVATENDARVAIEKKGLPEGWQGWAVRSLTEHPLAYW